jgi:hypothetical protein
MEHADLLRYLSAMLQRLGLRHFITGSTTTIFFGEPRFTNDIDVVVDLPEHRLAEFLAAFPEDSFYVSEEAARAALAQRGQFNIIHPESGLKIDVMVPSDTPYNRSRFERAVRVTPGDYEAFFASPEDAIIKKMQYYLEGGSDKHLRDIASMLKIMGGRIDRTYIAQWSARLGLDELWRQITERADSSG